MHLSRFIPILVFPAVLLLACAPSSDPPAPAPAAAPATAPAASPPAAPPAQEPPTVIPAPFLGEWNLVREDCGTSRNDSRLVIERERIAWWESSGPVTAVRVLPEDAIEVTARMSGEGETWESATRFKLEGADTLVTTDAAGGSLTRKRCPAA